MTPEERAEKLAKTIAIDTDALVGTRGCDEAGWASYQCELTRMLASEINDAVRAAVDSASQECLKCHRAHASLCSACFEGEKRAAVAEEVRERLGLLETVKLREAKAEAYEDAAKIVEAPLIQSLGQNEEAEKWLAAKIRARAKEGA